MRDFVLEDLQHDIVRHWVFPLQMRPREITELELRSVTIATRRARLVKMLLSYILPAVVVGMIHGAILPIALSKGVSPVHSPVV